jgi:uncharacterized membrane protein
MTDTWGDAIERLNAAASPPPASGAEPESASAPPSWPMYATPAPTGESPQAQPSDPLILELEHPIAAHAPAHPPLGDAPPSVFGRIEPFAPETAAPEISAAEAAPHGLTHLEAAPIPTPAPPAPIEAVLADPVPPVAEPVVAQAEKVLEPAPEPAEPAAVVTTAPVRAPVVVADPSPQPARPTLAEAPVTHASDPHGAIDPVLAGFDHVVALAGYVLLFISVFMFGVPALATMALAYAHKNDSHLLVRSHYRFQLRIFWTAVLFAVLAIASAVTAGGLAVSKLIEFARAHLPGVGAAMDQAHVGSWSAQIAGLLLIAAVTLGLLALVWTLIASLFGFLRLVSNRPIGHQYATK